MSKLIPKAYKFRFYQKIVNGLVSIVMPNMTEACLNLYNYNNNAAGTAVNACAGNVRPKTSKKIISKKSRAVSCETRIHVL